MKSRLRFSFIAIINFILLIQITNAQDDILFRRHVVYSGINGLFYGIAIDAITELDGGASAGVPVISAGISALLPLLTNSSRIITSNSLLLSGHGKIIGWSHGFALATVLGGENAWNNDNYKLTIAAGAAASIGLGILGNSLGKNTYWTEGQVALYRHYGWIGPFTGISLMATFSEEPRLYGASVLLFGAGSYLLADKIYHWNNYSRGDIRAIQVLSFLNGGLGYGITADIVNRNDFVRADFLLPAIGVLSGTIAGHFWLKNANLSSKQGMQSAYAAAGGAVLGLGIALLTESENATPYYLLPYITGLGAYTIAVETLRKKNESMNFFPETRQSDWQITFMPQNLFLNAKIPGNNFMVNGRLNRMQPLFAASLTF